jgi:hypothetical protein
MMWSVLVPAQVVREAQRRVQQLLQLCEFLLTADRAHDSSTIQGLASNTIAECRLKPFACCLISEQNERRRNFWPPLDTR